MFGSIVKSLPVLLWTAMSVLPSGDATIPFRLNPGVSWKSPVNASDCAAAGSVAPFPSGSLKMTARFESVK